MSHRAIAIAVAVALSFACAATGVAQAQSAVAELTRTEATIALRTAASQPVGLGTQATGLLVETHGGIENM